MKLIYKKSSFTKKVEALCTRKYFETTNNWHFCRKLTRVLYFCNNGVLVGAQLVALLHIQCIAKRGCRSYLSATQLKNDTKPNS